MTRLDPKSFSLHEQEKASSCATMDLPELAAMEPHELVLPTTNLSELVSLARIRLSWPPWIRLS
jgi:hypothetical protein